MHLVRDHELRSTGISFSEASANSPCLGRRATCREAWR